MRPIVTFSSKTRAVGMVLISLLIILIVITHLSGSKNANLRGCVIGDPSNPECIGTSSSGMGWSVCATDADCPDSPGTCELSSCTGGTCTYFPTCFPPSTCIAGTCTPPNDACCMTGGCTTVPPGTACSGNTYVATSCSDAIMTGDSKCVPETNCSDGIDNDDDGQTDCADTTSCLGSTAQCATPAPGMDSVCVSAGGGTCHIFETDCGNFNDAPINSDPTDDDGDGLANCADIDCNGSPACSGVSCGDGIVQATPAPGEQCDEGTINNADIPNRSCRSNCQLAKCGDGITDNAPSSIPAPRPAEECDSGAGNANTPDACRPNCKLPMCGDGIVDSGEECDLGSGSSNNDNPNSICRTNCKWAKCQDGIKDNAPPSPPFTLPVGHPLPPAHDAEECDDGNSINSDGCNAMCELPLCGNGVTDGIENCDIGKRCADGLTCTSNADCVAPHSGGCISRFGCSANCGVKQCTVSLGYPGYAPPIPSPPNPIPAAFTPVTSCAAQQALMDSMKTQCRDNTCGGNACTSVPSGRLIHCDNSMPLNGSTTDAEDETTVEEYYYCPTSYPNPPCGAHPPADLHWICEHPSYAPLCDPPFGAAVIAPVVGVVKVMPVFSLPTIISAFVTPPATPEKTAAENSAVASFIQMLRMLFGQ